jgi:hypothetical protein
MIARAFNELYLSRRILLPWSLAFIAPAVFFTLLTIGDLAGLNLNRPGSGWLVDFVPLCSLFTCVGMILVSSLPARAKVLWIVFSLGAMLLQVLVLVLVFGTIGLVFYGLEGVQ